MQHQIKQSMQTACDKPSQVLLRKALFLLICKDHKLDHTVASLGHLLPIMGTAGPCGCLLHKCFQLRKEKVGQCLPLVLSAPGCQE